MVPTTLTKSRFTVAMECPRKLDYARDSRYFDARENDEFLASLAEGGHQVGELARQMFPGGIMVSDKSVPDQIKTTAELLSLPEVVIFEATIQYENLLIRVDVLEKKDNQIHLFEVKAKGFDPKEDDFRTERGSHPVLAEWRPYLYDVTFQTYVLRLAYPEFAVTPHLMLLDKSVAVNVDGLNSMLPIETDGRQVTVTVDPAFDVHKIDPPVLRSIPVSTEVQVLLDHTLEVNGSQTPFSGFVDRASGILGAGSSFPVHIGSQCKRCSFYVDPVEATPDRKSGWAECMQTRFRSTPPRRSETVFGLYKVRPEVLTRLLEDGSFALATLSEDAVAPVDTAHDEIPLAHRQLFQVAEAHGEIEAPIIMKESLNRAIADWQWPLHFIDFETSRPALPYHRGRTPYDQILFQFSHHVLTAEGKLEHRTQCLQTAPGVAPSVRVLRALRDALSGDTGTVIHWWTHEKTVLEDIQHQMDADGISDRVPLSAFIDSLVGTKTLHGRLVDLGKLVSKFGYYPGTGGSSSIKKVLPAALRYSTGLRSRYSAPVYGTAELPSLNFRNWAWVREVDGAIHNPYTLLNPLLTSQELRAAVALAELENNGEADGFVSNGGAAIIAYDQLQRRTLLAAERTRIETELTRYCELDTLAMVMVYQALTGLGLGTHT